MVDSTLYVNKEMLKPLHKHVAIRPVFDSNRSPGGIIIPEMAQERADQGIVKYIGDECDQLKPGDYVLFSGYAGELIHLPEKDDEGTFIVMLEDSVACVLYPKDVNLGVKGLYFKTVSNSRELEKQINIILERFWVAGPNGLTISEAQFNILQEILKYESNKFIEATYEQAINMCSNAMVNSEFHRQNKINNKKEGRNI